MLAGAVGIGTAAGMAGGLWCAANARSLRARLLEAVAMIGLCAPPFVFGYGLLILFEPTFGHFKAPLFFDMHVYQPPYENPWDFFRAMLVPWIVAGAPVFAIALRITRSAVVEASEQDFMLRRSPRACRPRRRSTGTGVRWHTPRCSRGSAPRRP